MKSSLKLFGEIELINSFRAIFIRKLNAICISDLQLGYEQYLAEKGGIFLPRTQLKEIISELKAIFRIKKPKKIIINGDLKHEFGETSSQEWFEVRKLVEYLRKKVDEIILVRGNHDNYLLTIASHLEIEVFDPFYFEKGFCFLHGHKRIKYPNGTKFIIIGHEQPSILLKEGFDKVKIPCLLYGTTKDNKKLICLPSFSPLASGSPINVIGKDEILSPILREEADIDELKAIGLDKEAGPLELPKIKNIRIEL